MILSALCILSVVPDGADHGDRREEMKPQRCRVVSCNDGPAESGPFEDARDADQLEAAVSLSWLNPTSSNYTTYGFLNTGQCPSSV